MGDGTRAPTQIISLPQGGGALRGLGELSPDLHTGTGNFTVPIAVPAGRRGHQPELDLVYLTASGNGYLGLGWTLTVPGVARKTSHGVPRYDDERDTFILSGAEDLIPVDRADPHAVRYRPCTEGLFARIVHHCDPAAGIDYWEVASKDGLVIRYGSLRPEGAPATWWDPAAIADPGNPEKIFAWKLTETRDLFGNLIVYEYDADQGQAGGHRWSQALLRRICYADYEVAGEARFFASVTFKYEDRDDALSDYRAGFEIRTTRRCRSITTRTHADKDRPELDYEADPYSGVSLLTAVGVVGFDDAAAEHRDLPPLDFGYGQLAPEGRCFRPIRGSDPPPASLARGDYELVDLTGDGLPDVLELNGSARYWRNLGEGVLDRLRSMRTAPAGLRLADPSVQLFDADGDGHADLLVTTPGVAGYFPLRFDAAWGKFRPYRTAPGFNLKNPEVDDVRLTDHRWHIQDVGGIQGEAVSAAR